MNTKKNTEEELLILKDLLGECGFEVRLEKFPSKRCLFVKTPEHDKIRVELIDGRFLADAIILNIGMKRVFRSVYSAYAISPDLNYLIVI